LVDSTSLWSVDQIAVTWAWSSILWHKTRPHSFVALVEWSLNLLDQLLSPLVLVDIDEVILVLRNLLRAQHEIFTVHCCLYWVTSFFDLRVVNFFVWFVSELNLLCVWCIQRCPKFHRLSRIIFPLLLSTTFHRSGKGFHAYLLL